MALPSPPDQPKFVFIDDDGRRYTGAEALEREAEHYRHRDAARRRLPASVRRRIAAAYARERELREADPNWGERFDAIRHRARVEVGLYRRRPAGRAPRPGANTRRRGSRRGATSSQASRDSPSDEANDQPPGVTHPAQPGGRERGDGAVSRPRPRLQLDAAEVAALVAKPAWDRALVYRAAGLGLLERAVVEDQVRRAIAEEYRRSAR